MPDIIQIPSGYDFGDTTKTTSAPTTTGDVVTTVYKNTRTTYGTKTIKDSSGNVLATYQGRIEVPISNGETVTTKRSKNSSTRVGMFGTATGTVNDASGGSILGSNVNVVGYPEWVNEGVKDKHLTLPVNSTQAEINKWLKVNKLDIDSYKDYLKEHGKKFEIKITTSQKSDVEGQYEKNESGVVVNTSAASYDAAKTAKAQKEQEKRKKEEDERALSVLKSEVPVDVAELKALVQVLMKQNGLKIEAADGATTASNDDAERIRIEGLKAELYKYVSGTLGLNSKDAYLNNRPHDAHGNIIGKTEEQLIAGVDYIAYSTLDLEEAFLKHNKVSDRSNEDYAAYITAFFNKLVAENKLTVGPAIVPVFDDKTSIEKYLTEVKTYTKHIVETSGFRTLEQRSETENVLEKMLAKMNETLNQTVAKVDAKLQEMTTAQADINNQLGTINSTLSTISSDITTMKGDIDVLKDRTKIITGYTDAGGTVIPSLEDRLKDIDKRLKKLEP